MLRDARSIKGIYPLFGNLSPFVLNPSFMTSYPESTTVNWLPIINEYTSPPFYLKPLKATRMSLVKRCRCPISGSAMAGEGGSGGEYFRCRLNINQHAKGITNADRTMVTIEVLQTSPNNNITAVGFIFIKWFSSILSICPVHLILALY